MLLQVVISDPLLICLTSPRALVYLSYFWPVKYYLNILYFHNELIAEISLFVRAEEHYGLENLAIYASKKFWLLTKSCARLHVNGCEMSYLLAVSPKHTQIVFNSILDVHVITN